MYNTVSDNATLADVYRIMQVLKKYSDSEAVQKILNECFNEKNSDTTFARGVSEAIPQQQQQDEIV